MENIALIFQSLDDETRLRIVSLLLEEDELCVCDLVTVLQLPQSTVSRQLSLLKSAGWLKDRRKGIWIHYSINRSLAPIQQFIIPVLRNFLPATETAGKDLQRLKSRHDGGCCA